ncbi:MAG: hypothetical protein ACLSFA_19655 [Roseburia inulinivorans]
MTIGGNAKIYGNRTADGMNSNLSVGNGESSSTIINLSTDSPLTSEAKDMYKSFHVFKWKTNYNFL